MAALRPLRSENLVKRVLAQIREQILKGEWTQGEKIPSENELSRQFRVSRNTVRSAIHQLQALGILVARQGQGTFVNISFKTAYMGSMMPFISLSPGEILDLLEFRKILEAGSAALASQRADQENVGEIGKALERMLQSIDNLEEYSKADFDFHLAIAKASRNKLIHEVLNRLSVPLYSHLAEMTREFGARVSAEKHKRIFQSIRDGDVTRSEKLMRENIQASIEMVKKATVDSLKPSGSGATRAPRKRSRR